MSERAKAIRPTVPDLVINVHPFPIENFGLEAICFFDISGKHERSIAKISVLPMNGTPCSGESTHIRLSLPAW
jgi:hypothetical protein